MDSLTFTADTSPAYYTDPTKIYSSADITAYVSLPGKQSYRLGTLSMLSISTHRDKFPVTSLGRIRIKGYTAGPRTIGGTMVFSSFDRSVWHGLMSRPISYKGERNTLLLPDELPIFDISVTFVNEYGVVSYTGVLGVAILDEGETYSIDNISVMETYSYMAVDRIPFQPYTIGTKSSQEGDTALSIATDIYDNTVGVTKGKVPAGAALPNNYVGPSDPGIRYG
jgi:hypothetical protein